MTVLAAHPLLTAKLEFALVLLLLGLDSVISVLSVSDPSSLEL